MSGTCPATRVLRPGVEKSTPFSSGRYQDDQPYHYLPFLPPCVPPSSPLLVFSSSRLYVPGDAFPLAPSPSAKSASPPSLSAEVAPRSASRTTLSSSLSALANTYANHPFCLLRSISSPRLSFDFSYSLIRTTQKEASGAESTHMRNAMRSLAPETKLHMVTRWLSSP